MEGKEKKGKQAQQAAKKSKKVRFVKSTDLEPHSSTVVPETNTRRRTRQLQTLPLSLAFKLCGVLRPFKVSCLAYRDALKHTVSRFATRRSPSAMRQGSATLEAFHLALRSCDTPV